MPMLLIYSFKFRSALSHGRPSKQLLSILFGPIIKGLEIASVSGVARSTAATQRIYDTFVRAISRKRRVA